MSPQRCTHGGAPCPRIVDQMRMRLGEYEERDEQIWGEVPPRDGADRYAREVDPFYRPTDEPELTPAEVDAELENQYRWGYL